MYHRPKPNFFLFPERGVVEVEKILVDDHSGYVMYKGVPWNGILYTPEVNAKNKNPDSKNSYSRFMRYIIKEIFSYSSMSSLNRNTLVGLMVTGKDKKNKHSYLLLFGAALLQIITTLLGFIPFSYIAFGLTIFFILLLFINQKSLEYRIIHGLYGTTLYETREFIQFIIEHSDKSDFSDGDSLKKFLQEPLEEQEEESIYAGVPQI